MKGEKSREGGGEGTNEDMLDDRIKNSRICIVVVQSAIPVEHTIQLPGMEKLH